MKWLIVLLMAACGVVGPVVPEAASACERLKVLGCPEGLNARCVSVLTEVPVPVDTACLARAKSVEEVRACGGLKVRCEQRP